MTPLPQFRGGVERDWIPGLSVLGLQFCIASRLCRVTTAAQAFGLIDNRELTTDDQAVAFALREPGISRASLGV